MHAGYQVIEINASLASDRSESKLRERVADSTSMAAAFGDKRPHCLILDEIDGAMGGAQGKGAINALVEIIKGGDKQDRRPGPWLRTKTTPREAVAA